MRIRSDGARGLLFCAAKWSGAFPPKIPAGLRAPVSSLGGFTRPFCGNCFPPAGAPALCHHGRSGYKLCLDLASVTRAYSWCPSRCLGRYLRQRGAFASREEHSANEQRKGKYSPIFTRGKATRAAIYLPRGGVVCLV